jgi:hypothetical protein
MQMADVHVRCSSLKTTYFDRDRCLRTFAACFPSAVRVAFGRCTIVRAFRAAAAAFLMFFLAARFCFAVAISFSWSDQFRCSFISERQRTQ